jgi:hypothetical protein
MSTMIIQNCLYKLRRKYKIKNEFSCRIPSAFVLPKKFKKIKKVSQKIKIINTLDYSTYKVINFSCEYSLQELREIFNDINLIIAKQTVNYSKKYKNILYYFGNEKVDDDISIKIHEYKTKKELIDDIIPQFLEKAKKNIYEFFKNIDSINYLYNMEESDRYTLKDMKDYLKKPVEGGSIVKEDFYKTIYKALNHDLPTTFEEINKKYQDAFFNLCERIYRKYFNKDYEIEMVYDDQCPIEYVFI